MESPAPLDLARIRASLAASATAVTIHFEPEIDSTNRLAREIVHPDPAAVLTDYQTEGKGRRGRRWSAPPRSSVLCSVVLPLAGTMRPTDGPMIGALAVAATVEDVAGLAATIKWPNDVLIGGRKVAGILAEFHAAPSLRIILGMGVNVNVPASDLPTPDATSLLHELGLPVPREDVAVTLLHHIVAWHRRLADDGDAAFRSWRDRLDITGRLVEVRTDTGSWEGVAEGVARDGGLLVRRGRVVQTVYAADVSLRHPLQVPGPSLQ